MVCVSVFVTYQEARFGFEWFYDTSTRRLIRAISLCDRVRTCTARRRDVALALATPTSAKTNLVVRIGNGPSSEFGKSCDTNVVLSLLLLTLDINYCL